MRRLSSIGCPGVPAKAGSMAQWEGVEGDKSNWRGSAHARESTAIKVPPILAKVDLSTGDLLKE